MATALLLVFVDCVKELPATMLLRPFNFETLATRVHVQASLEDLPNAAPGAILIVLIGLCAVFLLARMNEQISQKIDFVYCKIESVYLMTILVPL